MAVEYSSASREDAQQMADALTQLDAVLAREQDPGLLQNDELRARA